MIFKKNNLLNGKTTLSDIFLSGDKKADRIGIYETGAQWLSNYIDDYNNGIATVKDFGSYVGNVDDRIRAQAETLKGNVGELSKYRDALKSSAEGLRNLSAKTVIQTAKQTTLNMVTKAGKMLLNGLVAGLVSFGVQKILEGSMWLLDEMSGKHAIEAAEKAIENVEKVQSAYKELQKTVSGTATSSGIAQEFAELTQGVSAMGENISLAGEDYDRFLELGNQLAELFPELTRHYDENGNAIVHLTGDVDGIVQSLEALVQRQRELANEKILDNADDIFKGVKTNIKSYKEDLQSLSGNIVLINLTSALSKEDVENAFLQYENASGGKNYQLNFDFGGQVSSAEIGQITHQLDSLLQETYGLSSSSVLPDRNGWEDYNAYLKLSEEDAKNFIENYQEYLQAIRDIAITDDNGNEWKPFSSLAANVLSDAAELESAIAAEASKLAPAISAQLQGHINYDTLTDIGQPIITAVASGMDLTQFDSWDEFAAAITGDNGLIAQYQKLANAALSDGSTIDLLSPLEQMIELSANQSIDSLDFVTHANALRDKIFEVYGVNTIESLNAVAPVIGAAVERMYGEQEDILHRYMTRLQQLGADDQVDLSGIVSARDQELFLKVSQGCDTATEALERYVRAKANLNVSDDLATVTTQVENIKAYTTSVSEALSGREITIEQYKTLVAYSEDYREALKLEGEQITLNHEAVQEITDSKLDEVRANIEVGKSAAAIAYHKNREELAKLRKELVDLRARGEDTADVLSRISELEGTQIDLTDAINQYAILSSTLSEVAQAYEEYNKAKSLPSPEEHYETGIEAYTALGKGLNSGKLGTSEFMASVDLVVPVEEYRDAVDQVAAIGKYYDDTLTRYFAVDPNDETNYTPGISNFLQDAESLQLMTKTFDENGVETWAVNAGETLESFANKMNITKAVAESMFMLMNSYSFGGKAFDFSDEFFGENSELQLYNLESQIDSAKKKLDALLEDGAISWDDDQIWELRQQIADLIEQKEKLEEETVVKVVGTTDGNGNVDTRGYFTVEADISEAEKKIEHFEEQLEKELSEEKRVEVQSNLDAENEKLKGLHEELGELGGEPTTVELQLALENVEAQLTAAKEKLNNFDRGNPVTLNVNGQVVWENQSELDQLQAEVDYWSNQSEQIQIKLGLDEEDAKTLSDINEEADALYKKIEDITNYTGEIEVTFSDVINAQSHVITLGKTLESVFGKKYKLSVSTSSSSPPPMPDYLKSAPLEAQEAWKRANGYYAGAQGTARAQGIPPLPSVWSSLRNEWKLKHAERALTGELGRELVVRGNRWFTVGDHGAEFANLQKGDIVFNHRQTEQLLSQGAINGRGKARLNGTIPDGNIARVTGSFQFRKYKTKNGVGDSGSVYSYTGSGAGPDSTDPEAFSETVDWIEKELDRLQRKIDQTAITAESAYKTFSERNAALASEFDQVVYKMEENRKGIARYKAEADSIGLDESYAQMVRDGAIDIEAITDEPLKQKIDLYAQWYEKALDLEDENAELEETLRDLAAQNFDNLIAEYEGVLNTIEHKKNMLDTYMQNAELRGQFVSNEYYKGLLAYEQENLATLSDKRSELNTELDNLVATGEVEQFSEKWYELKGEIEATDEAIAEANNSVIEISNSMRQAEWDKFDYVEERVKRVAEEAEFLSDLIGDDNLFDKDTGIFTDRAHAQAGLYGQNYSLHMDQAEQYGDAIKKINAELAQDPSNQILIQRKEDLIDAQREAVLSAKEEKQAMLDLAEEGYQAQLDIMNKLIDKKKEARDVERDLYEYQRDVAKQTENIASLQKQLSVYEAQGTEESRKKVQELRNQLADAEENLRDTEYDRFVAEQDRLFTGLTTEYQDFIDAKLSDSDALFAEMMGTVNANATDIGATLNETALSVGVEISDAIANIWSGSDPVSVFNGQFTDASASTLTALDLIRQAIVDYAAQEDARAKQTQEETDKNNAAIGNGSSSTVDTNSSSSSSSSSNSSSNSSSQNSSNGESGTNSGAYGTGTVIAPNGLNLRESASETSKILGAYGKGSGVTVLERVNNAWYKVKTADGKTGYMSASWLDVKKTTAASDSTIGTGTVTAPDGLRLRSSNSTNSATLGAYGYGTKVDVTEQKDNWYKVKAPDGKEGWMYGDWLKVVKQASYAQGGIIGDAIRSSGEDGMLFARTGEGILPKDQIAMLRNFASAIERVPVGVFDHLDGLTTVAGNIAGGDIRLNIETINLPNVTDPSEFAAGLRNAIKNDPTTQKAIRAITIDRLAGRNSLSVNKY